jgi:hypothetical protein
MIISALIIISILTASLLKNILNLKLSNGNLSWTN